MCQTGWRSSWWGRRDGRVGDYFSGTACAFGGGGGKTLCQSGRLPVLISMIDESVNQSIEDSINELKSQRVDKVIINVPLETEQAQKIAADNDDIVCLFLDVDPYSSVFNVSFNPADGTRASVKYLYEMGHREIALLAGRTAQSRPNSG